MKRVSVAIVAFILFFSFYQPSGAIIVLPALILIPIAKIVGIILGILSVPTLGLGAVFAKLTKHSVMKGFLIALGILVITGVVLALIIKLFNPDHSLF